MIRLFGKDDEDGALEFSEKEDKTWHKDKVGAPQRPFFVATTGNKKAALYLDPFSFLKAHGKRALSSSGHSANVLCLMEPGSRTIDLFLAENRHVTELHVCLAEHGNGQHAIDFFNTLKAKYASLGIDVKLGVGMELSRSREHDGLSL